jgi:hypothetical protein
VPTCRVCTNRQALENINTGLYRSHGSFQFSVPGCRKPLSGLGGKAHSRRLQSLKRLKAFLLCTRPQKTRM